MKSIGLGYRAGAAAVIETMTAHCVDRYCSRSAISLLLETIANSGHPMEFNQIRYFVVLARELHFTRAADACHVSQPALTKAIQKLEDELGGPLFLRERSHTQLTELGRMMLGPLERALASAHDAKRQADAFRRRETSPLRIGLEWSVPAAALTPVLSALRRSVLEIDLSMRHGSQLDLCERMLGGELDIALLVEGPDLHERLHHWRMFAEHYVVICPPDHRFRDRDAIGVSELAEECLLLNEDSDCPVRRFLGEVFEHNGVKPRRQHFATSQEQILEMVLASLGVSLVGERLSTVAPLLRRPIAADPDCRNVVLAAVAGRPFGPTPALFLKLMRAWAWSQDNRPAASDAAAAA
jgi:DNA-binding transcriptional LysR family regulator